MTTIPRPPKLRSPGRPRYANGLAVREKRVKAKLTQVQLAELANITQPHVSAIELGRSSPGVEVLHRLADIFKCEVGELMIKAES
ncbi:helix-turn-helix domain-containing protein [Nonomuraea typhae]|uniref:helix-turn-helix domain-containing protein n=1 Tax=Nonomuraea typhae TaxID=2603600 RepID=UPI0012F9D21A|nr:helix-turn-helix transcriptional regulator [Nonomuraea typhae]